MKLAIAAFLLLSTSAFAGDVLTCTIRGPLVTNRSPTIYTIKFKLQNNKYVFEATDSRKLSSPCELKGAKFELLVDKKNSKNYIFSATQKTDEGNISVPVLSSYLSGGERLQELAFMACDTSTKPEQMIEVNNMDEKLKCTKFNPLDFPHTKTDLGLDF